MTIKRHPLTKIALLRAKHRALRQRKYQPIQRMTPRISTSIWQTPTMHSFSRPLSPINKEYNEPEERSERKEMNWAQAKRAFPKLSPFGDVDKDGIYNMFDCKPFDRKRQGEEHMSAQSLIDDSIDIPAYEKKFASMLKEEKGPTDWDRRKNVFSRMRDMTDDKDERANLSESMDVMDDMKQRESSDQLAWNSGDGSRTASKNITGITKRYKRLPF